MKKSIILARLLVGALGVSSMTYAMPILAQSASSHMALGPECQQHSTEQCKPGVPAMIWARDTNGESCTSKPNPECTSTQTNGIINQSSNSKQPNANDATLVKQSVEKTTKGVIANALKTVVDAQNAKTSTGSNNSTNANNVKITQGSTPQPPVALP